MHFPFLPWLTSVVAVVARLLVGVNVHRILHPQSMPYLCLLLSPEIFVLSTREICYCVRHVHFHMAVWFLSHLSQEWSAR